MGARRGWQEGALPPPWKFNNMGAPKDNLTRKKMKKFKGPHIVSEETDLWGGPHIASEETDLRGPHIVCEETDLGGPSYSMRRNMSEGTQGPYSMRRN